LLASGDRVALKTTKSLYLSAAQASPMSGDAKSLTVTETNSPRDSHKMSGSTRETARAFASKKLVNRPMFANL
jgi:hypothetical protein